MAKLLKPNDRTFTATEVRLIGADGAQLDVVSLIKAREMANAAGLDLVVVSEKSDPPVVKIMDFGKLQYEYKKNLKSQRKNSAAQKLKEVKFHVNIDDHDYNYKLNHAIDFLQKGCKVKATLALRGREMAHQDLAYSLMAKITEALIGNGEPEGPAKMLGRNITVVFSPVKQPKGGKTVENVEADDEVVEE